MAYCKTLFCPLHLPKIQSQGYGPTTKHPWVLFCFFNHNHLIHAASRSPHYYPLSALLFLHLFLGTHSCPASNPTKPSLHAQNPAPTLPHSPPSARQCCKVLVPLKNWSIYSLGIYYRPLWFLMFLWKSPGFQNRFWTSYFLTYSRSS